MMSLRRILGLMLLFLFFEAIVAVASTIMYPDRNVFVSCIAMTGLAVGTWLLFVLLSRFFTRQRAPKAAAPQAVYVAAAPRTSPGDDSFTLEFSAMVNEANRRLQGLVMSDEQRSAPSVANLPLYLVLGAEGSGKTTAIVNSGIEARLLAGEAQRDGSVTPTALANLWFAEGAIFVEIAGRLLMDSPDRFERALQILRRQPEVPRWKRLLHGNTVVRANLRGVLVVCNSELFLQSRDVHRLGTVAQTLNERLQSVQAIMRPDFPTYVLMTRCDSILYFQEFFGALSEPESRRLLGVTLPPQHAANEYVSGYTDREGSRLTKLFGRLYQSIADKRLTFIAREESIEKRAKAYEFPRELKKIRGDVVQFLLDTFRPSTLQPPTRLRGFYFSGMRRVPRANVISDMTSVDQSVVPRRPTEATAFFRSGAKSSTLEYSIMATSASNQTAAKWTFLADLFRDIILNDPAGEVAATALRVEDSRYVNVALGVFGAVCLLCSVLWVFSWQNNHTMLTEVEAAVASTRVTASQNPLEILPELETIRPLLVRLHSYTLTRTPLSYRWGLYEGGRASADLDSFYYSRFRQAVLDPTLYAMSGKFLQLEPSAPVADDVYKELKTYRMLTSGNCKPEEPLISQVMLPVWTETISKDVDMQVIAEKQIQFYAREISHGDPYRRQNAENPEAVARAQTYLVDLKGPDKILQALLYQVREQPAERLSTYAGNYGQVLTGPDQMDGPFTASGWNAVEASIRDHKLDSNGEPCVVGKNAGAAGWVGDAAMDAQVQKQYSELYTQSWKQFLQSHHVVPFTSSTDAAQKLRTLADNNRSPLLALVFMTSSNTNVSVPQTLQDRAAKGLQTVATDTSNTFRAAINKIGGGKTAPPQAVTANVPATPVTVQSAFDPAHATVDPNSRGTWLNDKNKPYMNALSALSDAVQALPTQVHTDVPSETMALQQARAAVSAANEALHALAGDFPNTSNGVDVDLQNLLREPIELANRDISGIPIVKAAPLSASGGPVAPVPLPPDPGAQARVKASIRQVNTSMLAVCSTASALQRKFPFDATSTTDASLDEVNQLLLPGTGSYPQFANLPDVSKTYNHAGRIWAANPAFPATYSQPFLGTLNRLGEVEDELYGDGSTAPHIDMTLTVDGTGKIPFEIDVDGHVLKFNPGHATAPLQLSWPPITGSPTRLIIRNGSKNNFTSEWTGIWGLFHLLQSADDQSGSVYTYRTVQFAHGLNPLTNDKGAPATVQIRINSAAANIFQKGYFSKLRCEESWAIQPQSPTN